MGEILLEKKNLYISVYRRLEKEVMALADSILFDDTQKNVYSSIIGDIILRCSADIEAISKDLYYKFKPEEKTEEEDTKLKFDYQCIKLLIQEWKIDKKKIRISHPNMYFSECELTPLLHSEKGVKEDPNKPNNTDICRWKQAYQKIKHNRTENISKATVWNMLNALGALYILNLYYADESFWVETPIEKRNKYTNFSEIFEPALCDTTKLGISAQKNPETITKLINPTFDESIFILKYTDDAFTAMQKVVADTINSASNIRGIKSADDLVQKISTQVLPQYVMKFKDAINGLKNKEVILNKNTLPIFGI